MILHSVWKAWRLVNVFSFLKNAKRINIKILRIDDKIITPNSQNVL